MQLFAIVIMVQILIGSVLINASSITTKPTDRSQKRVLGTTTLAQDDSNSTSQSPDSSQPPDQPTDTPPIDQISQDQSVSPMLSPIDNSIESPTPTPFNSSSDNSDSISPSLSPDETNIIDNSDNAIMESLGPSPTFVPSPTLTDVNDVGNKTSITLETPTPIPTVQDQNIIDTNTTSPVDETIINLDNTIKTTSSIPQQTIQQTAQQDDEINKATNPTQQNQILIQAVKENVTSLNDVVQQNNYATAAFLTQRVTDEITKVVQNTQNTQLHPQDISQAKTFCRQADLSLKTQQLLVPSELEQDIEIARGLCNNIQ